jgi:hypothetical protein
MKFPQRDYYVDRRSEFILALLGSVLHPLSRTHIYYHGKDYYV